MLDLRQTREYADFLHREGWVVETIDGVNYFIRRLPFGLKIMKLQHPQKLNINCIHELIHEYKIFQTIVEPNNQKQAELLARNGFRLSKSTFLPSKTLQIDLTKSQKDIYKDFERNIKNGIKKAYGPDYSGERENESNQRATASLRVNDPERSRRGEWPSNIKEYSTLEELKIFHNSWKKIIKNKRYVPSLQTLLNLRKSFTKNKSLFLASHNILGRIIGGVFFTISSHETSNYITYYNYGFTSKEGRTSLVHAALLYHGILWGKRMGAKIFDFEGIYDKRFPNKSWLGFTRFKKSFGGYEVAYPGTFVKYRLPI